MIQIVSVILLVVFLWLACGFTACVLANLVEFGLKGKDKVLDEYDTGMFYGTGPIGLGVVAFEFIRMNLNLRFVYDAPNKVANMIRDKINKEVK